MTYRIIGHGSSLTSSYYSWLQRLTDPFQVVGNFAYLGAHLNDPGEWARWQHYHCQGRHFSPLITDAVVYMGYDVNHAWTETMEGAVARMLYVVNSTLQDCDDVFVVTSPGLIPSSIIPDVTIYNQVVNDYWEELIPLLPPETHLIDTRGFLDPFDYEDHVHPTPAGHLKLSQGIQPLMEAALGIE